MMQPKEDPARAAALPATLPLGGKKTDAAAFSATTFEELPIDAYLQRHLTQRMELAHMTPVQQHAIPSLLSGGDLLVRSPTGSGKTLAYAVPIVQALVQRGAAVVSRTAGTFAVVLVPTRELCLQTHEVVERLTSPYPWLVTSTLMGGERRKAEKARLRKGVALLVGTPGRVADHASTTKAWRLSECAHLVLDEADRLLDLGFQNSIDAILECIEARRAPDASLRQTVLLSATLSKGLRELAGRSLSAYATLQISAKGAELTQHSETAEAGCSEMADREGGARGADAGVAAAGATPSGVSALCEASVAGSAAGSTPGRAAGIMRPGEKLDAPSGLVQSYALVPTKQRLTALLAFARSKSMESDACKMVIFVSSCDAVDFLFELLGAAGSWPDLHTAAVATGHAAAGADSDGLTRWAEGGAEGRGAEEKGEESDDEGEWEEAEDGSYHRVGGAKRKREGGADAGGFSASQGADGLSFACALLGNTVLRLHGKMSQRDRTQAFARFRESKSGVLIATDVAARGLNLQGVHWIVQYDLPQDAKEYLHRAGRAARLGQQGQALLLLHQSEAPFLQLLRTAGVAPRELKFASLQAALCPKGGRRDIYVMEIALQRQLERVVSERAFLHEGASAAYQSYLRGYAAHSKVVQRLVHVGQLHLGHLAKSFGLKEQPSKLARQQHKRQATARAPAGKAAAAAYLAGGNDYVAGGAPRKLSLAERMRKQPNARKALPVGTAASVSEFGAGFA